MADIIFPGSTPQGNLGATWLPSNMDLSIWQGDYQEFFVDFVDGSGSPFPLTGYTIQAVIKTAPKANTGYSFTCTVPGATNRVRVYMPSTVASTIPPGDYIWNLQLTNASGDVKTYLAGDVKVYAEVD